MEVKTVRTKFNIIEIIEEMQALFGEDAFRIENELEEEH
jgi:hypothetical protein